MVRQRFHRGEQVAAQNMERAIAMRRRLFVGWAGSAASALRGVLPRWAGHAIAPRALFHPEDRR